MRRNYATLACIAAALAAWFSGQPGGHAVAFIAASMGLLILISSLTSITGWRS